VSFSNGDIIYKNLEIKGFGIDAWIQGKTGQELDETWNGVLSDIQNHKLKVGYDQVYPLAEFKRAIEDYNKNGRRIILK
jgi:NADPH:quinone reductase-like Zn-dependent oxidoreductase